MQSPEQILSPQTRVTAYHERSAAAVTFAVRKPLSNDKSSRVNSRKGAQETYQAMAVKITRNACGRLRP